jgi:peptide/nickel transport system permease protein
MGPYLLRRVLLMIPTFVGITLLTFGVMQLAPGDPFALRADALDAGTPNAEAVEALRRAHGYDRPLWEQYARWVGRVVTFDFGRSLQDGRPVTERMAEALPRTILLATLALLLSYLIAVPLGTVAAVKRDSLLDRVITFALFLLYSLPAFWVALLLLLYLAGGRGVVWFPLQGLTSPGFEALGFGGKLADLAWHLVLPVGVLTYGSLALISRHVRSGLLEIVREDFIRTARAKGLDERTVVLRHALRNSLLPVVTLFGLMLPQVLGGSVIVEQIFGIPGMGQLAFEAILHRDYPTVMGITTLVAILTMLSMLATDLAYAAIDPRVRPEAVR